MVEVLNPRAAARMVAAIPGGGSGWGCFHLTATPPSLEMMLCGRKQAESSTWVMKGEKYKSCKKSEAHKGIRKAFPAADQQPAWAGLTDGFHWAAEPLSFEALQFQVMLCFLRAEAVPG